MSATVSQAVLWKPNPAPFSKEIISKGYGFHTPQDGSVCKIKVLSDEAQLLKELNDQTKELLVGDVDESIDRIIEDCIRSMKEEEICQIKFSYPLQLDQSVPQLKSTTNEISDESLISDSEKGNIVDEEKTGDDKLENVDDSEKLENVDNSEKLENIDDSEKLISENNPSCNTDIVESLVPSDVSCSEDDIKSSDEFNIEIQLLSYTREPEIWEMSVTEKWRRANYHKQKGLELYARGVYQYAFRRFGLTLKYVISLEHDIPAGQEEGMDISGLKLSCYLNVAACQMRHHNFDSVVINSTKALLMQPNSAKALYRRGAAYVQLQEFDKAKDDLTKAQELEPKNQAIVKQLQILKSQVQKLNQYYASAMKKMFS